MADSNPKAAPIKKARSMMALPMWIVLVFLFATLLAIIVPYLPYIFKIDIHVPIRQDMTLTAIVVTASFALFAVFALLSGFYIEKMESLNNELVDEDRRIRETQGKLDNAVKKTDNMFSDIHYVFYLVAYDNFIDRRYTQAASILLRLKWNPDAGLLKDKFYLATLASMSRSNREADRQTIPRSYQIKDLMVISELFLNACNEMQGNLAASSRQFFNASLKDYRGQINSLMQEIENAQDQTLIEAWF